MDGQATCIYVLHDPSGVSDRVYVGKTVRPRHRLAYHLKTTSKHRTIAGRWIASLLNRGIRPAMDVVEIVPPGGEWQDAERFWISSLRGMGFPMCNLTEGGDGVSGLPSARRNAVDWSKYPLGRMGDRVIAKMAGVSAPTVARERKIRCIPAYKKPPDAVFVAACESLLGSVPDATIGKLCGVTSGAVLYARRRRGIAPRIAIRASEFWDAQPLGRVWDVQLALAVGVTPDAVAVQRRQRNIPEYSERRFCIECSRPFIAVRDKHRLCSQRCNWILAARRKKERE